MEFFAFTTASGERRVLPFPMTLPLDEREQYMADAIASADAEPVLPADTPDSVSDED